MSEKIHWKHEYEIFPQKILYKYNEYVNVIRVNDGEQNCNLIYEPRIYVHTQKGSFNLGYSSCNELSRVHVVPGEELELVVRNMSRYTKTKLTIKKINDDKYDVVIHSSSYCTEYKYDGWTCSPQHDGIDIKETLTLNELKEKMYNMTSSIQIYPFILPLGSCFAL